MFLYFSYLRSKCAILSVFKLLVYKIIYGKSLLRNWYIYHETANLCPICVFFFIRKKEIHCVSTNCFCIYIQSIFLQINGTCCYRYLAKIKKKFNFKGALKISCFYQILIKFSACIFMKAVYIVIKHNESVVATKSLYQEIRKSPQISYFLKTKQSNNLYVTFYENDSLKKPIKISNFNCF